MSFKKIKQGSAVRLTLETREYDVSWDLALSTPDTTINVTVKDSNGDTVVSDQAMTADATGKYRYYYQVGASAPVGFYRAIYKVVDGGVTTYATDHMAFKVEAQ